MIAVSPAELRPEATTGFDRVTAIVIAYHSRDPAAALLAKLPPEMPRVVVDNSPVDVMGEVVAAQTSPTRLVHQPDNPGFSAACNAGARLVETEFFLILNPDVELDAAALTECLAAMDQDPRLAVVCADRRPMKILKVPVGEWAEGAFLFTRRSAFDSIGGFDEDFFLYWEDVDFSVRLRRAGHLIKVLDTPVRHAEGTSVSAENDSAAERRWLRGGSAEIFARKHRGTLAGLYGRWRQLKYDYECIRRGDRAFNERAGARAVRSDGFAALRPNLFTGGARRSRG